MGTRAMFSTFCLSPAAKQATRRSDTRDRGSAAWVRSSVFGDEEIPIRGRVPEGEFLLSRSFSTTRIPPPASGRGLGGGDRSSLRSRECHARSRAHRRSGPSPDPSREREGGKSEKHQLQKPKPSPAMRVSPCSRPVGPPLAAG